MNCGSRHCESLREANRCRQAGPGWRREAHALAHRMCALIRQLFLCDCVCLRQSQFVHSVRQHSLNWSCFFLVRTVFTWSSVKLASPRRVCSMQVHADRMQNGKKRLQLTLQYELVHTNFRNPRYVAVKHTNSQHVPN